MYTLIFLKKVRNKAKFVLAIGQHGPSWFKSIGYIDKTIFPLRILLTHLSQLMVRNYLATG